MTYYDDIYEHAVDNYYLITTQEAEDIGVPGIELVKLAKRGRLENLAYGVYRLARYVPDENDPYAIAVAKVGADAYLYGESVIALLGLAPTNPACICVATTKRVRKKLPETIRLFDMQKPSLITIYEGIRCQKLKDAILACKDAMMNDRLRDAAITAKEQGYLTAKEAAELEEAMGWQRRSLTASETSIWQ